MHASVDVGGTFTDIAFWDGERLITGKVPTTVDQSEGVIEALGTHGRPGARLLHGTTVATNAVLQRRGARLALVTDAGFEDLIEIGRQDRPSLYDLHAVRPDPLVPGVLRFGLPGRSLPGSSGTVEAGDVETLIAALAEAAPEAVAVSLLHSFDHPERERAVGRALAERLPDLMLSLSSDVVGEFREFERASTTALNAYLLPVVATYLRNLARAAAEAGVSGAPAVMRSSGGLMALADAAALPAAIVLSGPAGGAVAASALGRALGYESVVSFDMGGTSTDVCRIESGRPGISYERPIDGLPCRMPSVAINTVGAGGGSIGWADPGGALRVGPTSAGSTPGPASYGRGGREATVTDANLLLGRIGADARLGGSLSLDIDAARAALAVLGGQASLDPESAALGVVTVVESHMERAIRRVSIEEGADPRRAALVAFGGAGGLHASALARRLDMERVVVPAHAGVFSAFGMLLAPPRADVARSVLLEEGGDLDGPITDVTGRARDALGGTPDVGVVIDVRYRGQSHETSVPYRPGEGWPELIERFHEAHRVRNGFARPGDPVEAVTVRAQAEGTPALTWDHVSVTFEDGEPSRDARPVLTERGEVDASVWWRPRLRPGAEITGPAIVEEPEATTFVADGEVLRVHESGAMEVTW